MLRDVDLSLATWLGGLLPAGGAVVFDVPGADGPADAPAGPILALHLHDVREEAEITVADWSTLRGEDGLVVGRMPPQRRYRLTYLVTAWAADTLQEHEILGTVLAGTAAHHTIPAGALCGSLVENHQPATVRCAPLERGCDPRELWAAWRIPPRTSIELSVLVPLPVSLITDIPAPPRGISVNSSRR